MPSIEWNARAWGSTHSWEQEGDEWAGMAAYCHQPYPEWKQTLVDAFVTRYAPGADVLEVAPGHGRWSEVLVQQRPRSLTLVDLNASCIEACRARLGDRPEVSYHVNDGRTLPVADASTDFVWSFDSFVHIDPPEFEAYVVEMGRVLRPGGTAVLHHAAKVDAALGVGRRLARFGPPGRFAKRLLTQHRFGPDGNRSDVTRRMVERMAHRAGLRVVDQVDSWGEDGRYTVKRFHDSITTLARG